MKTVQGLKKSGSGSMSAAMAVGMIFVLWAHCVLADTGNLLLNPGAELDIAYWTPVGGFTTSAPAGYWHFYKSIF